MLLSQITPPKETGTPITTTTASTDDKIVKRKNLDKTSSSLKRMRCSETLHQEANITSNTRAEAEVLAPVSMSMKEEKSDTKKANEEISEKEIQESGHGENVNYQELSEKYKELLINLGRAYKILNSTFGSYIVSVEQERRHFRKKNPSKEENGLKIEEEEDDDDNLLCTSQLEDESIHFLSHSQESDGYATISDNNKKSSNQENILNLDASEEQPPSNSIPLQRFESLTSHISNISSFIESDFLLEPTTNADQLNRSLTMELDEIMHLDSMQAPLMRFNSLQQNDDASVSTLQVTNFQAPQPIAPVVRVGVGVLVKDPKNPHKVFAGIRKGSHGANTLALPGGHLEIGESWEECAIREVKEETGLDIHNVQFAHVTNDIYHEENKHYVTVFVMATCVHEEVIPQNLQPHKCFGWESYSLEDLEHIGNGYDEKKQLFLSLLNFIGDVPSHVKEFINS